MTEKNIRLIIRKKIYNILNNKENSKLLEKSIYTYCKNEGLKKGIDILFENELFKILYIQKSRSIIHNLDKNSYIQNTTLLDKINSNKLNLLDLPNLEHFEIFPERWDFYIEKQKILDKRLTDIPPASTTDQFKCPKCKQRKCTYVSVQIRSADEPMTSFVSCLVEGCNYAWRE